MIYATLEVKIVVPENKHVSDVQNSIKNLYSVVKSVEVKYKEVVK